MRICDNAQHRSRPACVESTVIRRSTCDRLELANPGGWKRRELFFEIIPPFYKMGAAEKDIEKRRCGDSKVA